MPEFIYNDSELHQEFENDQSADEKGQMEFSLQQKIDSSPQLKSVTEIKGKEKDRPKTDLEINKETAGHQKLAIEEENKTVDPYDPTLDLSKYRSPQTDLLHDYSENKIEKDRQELYVCQYAGS